MTKRAGHDRLMIQMVNSLNKEKPIVRLRAFRAIDDPASCALFVRGHEQVLTSIGVHKVTSSKNEWPQNPAAFVIIVESLDGAKVYGGARVHVSGGSELLPIEEATGSMNAGIFELVWKYAQQGTGEICGLWNSREIAGYGIGSIFLTRAAVAISTQIGLVSLFALCASYTAFPFILSKMRPTYSPAPGAIIYISQLLRGHFDTAPLTRSKMALASSGFKRKCLAADRANSGSRELSFSEIFKVKPFPCGLAFIS